VDAIHPGCFLHRLKDLGAEFGVVESQLLHPVAEHIQMLFQQLDRGQGLAGALDALFQNPLEFLQGRGRGRRGGQWVRGNRSARISLPSSQARSVGHQPRRRLPASPVSPAQATMNWAASIRSRVAGGMGGRLSGGGMGWRQVRDPVHGFPEFW